MFLPNHIYHIYNRGINRERLFYSKKNYGFFKDKIRAYICPVADLLAYCLMPNHFHLLVRTSDASVEKRTTAGGLPMHNMTCLSWGLKQLLSSYAKAINKQRDRVGSLFCQNTPRRITDSPDDPEGYSAWCFHYIHINPCRAGLVEHPGMWEFSSYNEYFATGKGMCNVPLAEELLHFDQNVFTLIADPPKYSLAF